KPENIFITSSVRRAVLPKILDFGIAKMHEANRSLRTETGVALGTPAYMSPEQVTAVGDVDHRTDIWALGVVIYECLSGVLPFDAPNLTALLHRISTVQYVPLGARPEGGYDPTLMAIVDRCLRLNPSQRFQSMGELLGALAQSPAWDAEALGSLRPPSAPVMLGEEEPEDTEVRAQAAVPDRALRTAPGAPTLVDVPGVGGAGEGAGAVGATDGFEGATTGELRAALTGRRSGARVLGVAILVAALVAVGVILMPGGAGEAAMPAASPGPSAAPAAVPSEGEAREPAAEPEPSEGSTVGSAAGLGADAARDLDAGVDAGGAVAPKVGTRGRTHVKSRRVSKPRGRKTIEVPPEL
ncbi:MAG: protein kinase, partial [Myxococcales bacterium]|nr:protein kinase [Myxococcales bacterium]